MDISIVIPTLNGGSRLIECAKSLTNQKIKYLFEIVLIDSGSQDGSIEKFVFIIKEARLPLIVIKIEKTDFQHGATRNHAIENTSGEIIVLLTQDAVPYDSLWLNNLISNFRLDSDIAGVFGRHVAHKNNPPLIRRDIENHFLYMAQTIERKIENIDEYNCNEKLRQKLHYFSNNNAAIRKCIWEKIPFPNVSFGEDQTWAKLVLEKGLKIFYCSDAVVYHSHNYGFIEIIQRNIIEVKYFKKYFGYDLTKTPLGFLKDLYRSTVNDFRWLKNNKVFSLNECSKSLKSNIGSNLARLYCFIYRKSL